MIAEVIPAVPALGVPVLFAVSLGAALVALTLILLRFVTVTLIGTLLGWIGSALSIIPFIGGWTADEIGKGINAVDTALGAAISSSEGLAVSMFHDAIKLAVWTYRETLHLAEETAHGFNVLVNHTIPNTVGNAAGRLRAQLEAIIANARHLEHNIVKGLRRDLTATDHALAREATKARQEIEAVEHTAGVTLPHEIAHEIGEVRGWTAKQLRALLRRISRLEALLGLGALTGVVLGIIARELPWIRCRNVGKVGKALCGLPVQQLEKELGKALLGLTAIFGTVSLLELAEEYQRLFGGVSGEIRHFWRADVANGPANPGLGNTGFLGKYAVPSHSGPRDPGLGDTGL